MARDIAASHHEHFDGTGYPNALAGHAIPLSARIVTVADVYDALSNKRAYKEAYPHDLARNLILKDAGTHFDPLIIAAFQSAEPAILAIHNQYATQDNTPNSGAEARG